MFLVASRAVSARFRLKRLGTRPSISRSITNCQTHNSRSAAELKLSEGGGRQSAIRTKKQKVSCSFFLVGSGRRVAVGLNKLRCVVRCVSQQHPLHTHNFSCTKDKIDTFNESHEDYNILFLQRYCQTQDVQNFTTELSIVESCGEKGGQEHDKNRI